MHWVEVKWYLTIWYKALEEIQICCHHDPQKLMGKSQACVPNPCLHSSENNHIKLLENLYLSDKKRVYS